MEMRMVGLSEEQKQIWQVCHDFVDAQVIPFVRANREREWRAPPEERLPMELLRSAHKIGLRTLGVPEKYGGSRFEAPAQTFALIGEELARGDSGFADMLCQTWKVSVLLSACAPQCLQDEWFPRIAGDPDLLLAHALTEPRGASDRWLPYNVPEANMQTKAVHHDGGWVLNGRKQFITNGYDAKLYVVYADTNPNVGILDGTSSFLVPRGTPGFTPTRVNEKIGSRFMNNGEMVFDDCWIPEDHLLVKDVALRKAGVYFRPGKILQAAKALGVAAAAFDDAVAFVHQQVQGGRPLIQHQIVAATVADMAIKLHTVRAFIRYAARALDEGASDADQLCLMAKVYSADAAFEVCKQAMELHGGSGVMLEVGVEKHLRDAAVFLHMDGTQDIHRFKIVKSMFPDTAGTYAG
ncbi:MAG: acyl-CoA/acyl-ACP dehydrogenase [Chloroflexi bacterium]|nr:acyl-CoA/acyl-ACP dehydrogenase [Chloroflexota bacterium]